MKIILMARLFYVRSNEVMCNTMFSDMFLIDFYIALRIWVDIF